MTVVARLTLALVLAAGAADAQTIVTSPGPDHVGVTIYRAPNRSPGVAIDREWLEGYALISETRQVTLPAGEAELRFEGVAGGIIPQSAIVTGFPEGIVERNRDAYLLSAVSLLDRTLGRRVHLRRTSGATGAVTEQDAIVRSGPDGALVVQTRDGFEALRCTGLAETPVYDEVPAGLSARPTLSLRTRSSRPVSATVTLSYLATGFDWQANYVGSLSPDGTSLDLFAWLVLASSDETSFRDADTQAVAGRINSESVEPEQRDTESLQLRCWSEQRTSDIPLSGGEVPQHISRNSDTVVDSITAQDIGAMPDRNVTEALARMVASQENLGDLKLYRIPEPVTVASNSQKQVAFLQRDHVRVDMVYRQLVHPSAIRDAAPATRMLVTRNRSEDGLGIPLPGGRIQLFAAAARPLLLGEGSARDYAIGEDVEIGIGEDPGVTTSLTSPTKHDDYLLTVTNDRAQPVRYEADFVVVADHDFRPRIRLPRRNGRPLWSVTIPANGSATLRYVYRDQGH